MAELLPCVELNPGSNATASVIWLHGLGANGHDFVPVVPQLELPAELSIRFVFPHAPSIPITINHHYVMPAWFDVLELGKERSFNPHQLLASSAAVHALIDREIERGVAADRILLAGFSQRNLSIDDETMSINYGLNKVRFPSPVRCGSRVRARFVLQSCTAADGGPGGRPGLQLVMRATIEIEGSDKPACVAEAVRLTFR